MGMKVKSMEAVLIRSVCASEGWVMSFAPAQSRTDKQAGKMAEKDEKERRLMQWIDRQYLKLTGWTSESTNSISTNFANNYYSSSTRSIFQLSLGFAVYDSRCCLIYAHAVYTVHNIQSFNNHRERSRRFDLRLHNWVKNMSDIIKFQALSYIE